MDHEDFRNFEQLSQLLHFGRAAQALGMSPSALTRRVQAWELELGVPLLLRDQRSVRLTAAGERTRIYARRELDQWQQLQNELRQALESPSGDLYIACTVTACHSVLPRLLALARERFPGLTLRLVTQDAERSLAALEAGEVDLAVIPTEEPGPAHLETCLLTRTALTFIAPDDPELLRRLLPGPGGRQWKTSFQATPLIAPQAGLDRQRLDDWLRRHRIDARIVAEVRGNEGIMAMVSLGSGIGLVPRLVLDSSSLPVHVLDEIPAPPGYAVSLCARTKSLGRDVVRVFWKLAQEL